MTEGTVPPLVLGEGSPKRANVAASSLRGHLGVIGTPAASASVVADLARWAAQLKAGVVLVDLDGRLSALMVDMAGRGDLDGVDLRLLTPSSPVGIPVVLKPFSGLSSAIGSDGWKRLRGWVPQLMATLAGQGPGTPDHERVAGWFLSLLDRTKETNPSIMTVQGLVGALKQALASGEAPMTQEVGEALVADMTDMAEDLRIAALSYGAPVDLRRLLETPVFCGDGEGDGAGRRHIDVLLLSHMGQVADRNSTITALMLEVFQWCRLRGKQGRLLVAVPEVESPLSFVSRRPFAQRLTARVLAASKGTGLLATVLPRSLEDPAGMPRFGAVLLEKARYDDQKGPLEEVLRHQGMAPSAWARMSMLNQDEWALAAGVEFSKWHRFSPAPDAVAERELDTEVLKRLLSEGVRDAFRYAPKEDECIEEGEPAEDATRSREAAQVVEDAEDLLSYTTERKPQRREGRMHQEVQELLKRKLEEKERAKEASRYELKEIDLVEGEEPSEMELASQAPRPLSDGVIDDQRATDPEGPPGLELHADDLKLELAVLEARDADSSRHGREDGPQPDLVVDLDRPDEGWESVSVEVALGADDAPGEGEGEGEDEELIVEVEEDR